MEKVFIQRTGVLDRPGTSAWIGEKLVDGVTPGAVVDEATRGAVTTGTAGAMMFWEPMMGDTPGVGTEAMELTPRLPISVEPSGIPARAAPPGTVGEVGTDDAARLLEPEPHMPDMPDVSSTPEGVDMPELADMADAAEGPADMLGDSAVLPADMPVAGIELSGVAPPPSNVSDEPNIAADEVPNVVHGMPLPGIAMVPVGLIGAGLVPADVISVAPSGIPVPPTEVPLVTSSGEVVPIDGVGITMLCATATWLATSMGSSAAINDSFTGVLRTRPDWLARAFAKTNQRQAVSGRLTTMGVGVLRTTTQRNTCSPDGLISMCGRKAGT